MPIDHRQENKVQKRSTSLYLDNRFVSLETITKVVADQFQIILTKHRTITREKKLKHHDTNKAKESILLCWLDIASSYMGIIKLIYSNDYFNDYNVHEILIQLFSPTYFILNLIFPSLAIENQEDVLYINNLQLLMTQILEVGEFNYELKLTVEECDKLINNENKKLEKQKLDNRYSVVSELYPTNEDSEYEETDSPYTDDNDNDNDNDSENENYKIINSSGNLSFKSDYSLNEKLKDFEIRSIDYKKLFGYDEDSTLIFDIQSLHHTKYSSPLNVLNVDPLIIQISSSFDHLISNLDPADVDIKKFKNFYKFKTIVYFSLSSSLSDIDQKFDNLLKRELHRRTDSKNTKVFWLDGGHSSWKLFLSVYEHQSINGNTNSVLKLNNYSPPPLPPMPAPVLNNITDIGSISSKNPNQSHTYNHFIVPPPSGSKKIQPTNSNDSKDSSIREVDQATNDNTISSALYTRPESNFKFITKNSIQDKPLSTPKMNLPPIPQPMPHEKILELQSQTFLHSKDQNSKQSLISSITPSYCPMIGFFNFGSTCYINSMLQCLFSISTFRNFFIDRQSLSQYEKYISHKDPLTHAFFNLFTDIYRISPHGSNIQTIKPAELLRLCAHLKPELSIPHEQQDTSQFLYFITGRLHEELKLKDSSESRNLLTTFHSDDVFKLHSTTKEYIKWQQSLIKSEGLSIIQSMFGMEQEICLKCTRCGYKSIKFESSTMMHLNLSGTERKLEEIIWKNLSEEEMSERLGNAWNCDGCEKLKKRMIVLEEKCEEETMKDKEKERERDKDKDKDKWKEENKENKDSKEKDKHKKRSFFKKILKEGKEAYKESNNKNEISFKDLTPDIGDDGGLRWERLSDEERAEYQSIVDVMNKSNVSVRSVKYVKLPKILVVYLAKFNPYKKEGKINADQLMFPKILDIDFDKGKKKYVLNSWIDHLGSSVDSGHYTAVVSRPGDLWVRCDDDHLWREPYGNIAFLTDPDVYLLFYTLLD